MKDIDDYETLGSFDAGWSGRCTIDPDHTIKRGDRVAKIQLKANPLLPVTGVACKHCTSHLKGYKKPFRG